MKRISIVAAGLLAGNCLLFSQGCRDAPTANSADRTDATTKTESGESAPTAPTAPTMVRAKPLPFEQMSPLVDAYKSIGDVLDLSPDQRKQFDAIYDKHFPKLDHWFNQVAGGVRGYQVEWYDDYAKILCKRITGNPDFPLTSEQVVELARQERQLQREFETDLLAAIPAEKMETWRRHRLAVLLLDYYEKLDLTESQAEAIKQLAPQALENVKKNQQNNWQQWGTLGLDDLAVKKVLNSDQKRIHQQYLKRHRVAQYWQNPSKPDIQFKSSRERAREWIRKHTQSK